jgi:hypothetical protein
MFPVDAQSIAMSMIKQASELNAHKLCEFVISRTAIGRGGEHMPLRWNEGTYDYYFMAPDLDWSLQKTCARQCMLFFCDRLSYALCPFFAFAVYFLYGGLSRAGVSSTIHDFVFPHLHNIRKDGVANRLTRAIREHIDTGDLPTETAKKRKLSFTSRSHRKGTMTENRLHRDLSTQEEYARSGHTITHVAMNNNAEGYIESTPSMNAPEGMALAGYTNCHVVPKPYSFGIISHATEAVARLIKELFINDVPELQV